MPYFEFWTARCIGIVRTMTIFAHLICLRICVMRCFGIVRTMPTSSSSWSTDHTYGLRLCVLSSSETTLFIASADDIVLPRLCFTLWIGYYSGRKTTAIQLYLADLHCECRTEHSVLHWGLRLWDAISMWKADLEMERFVSITFCIQKKVVQNTLCEPLRSWEANAYISVTC